MNKGNDEFKLIFIIGMILSLCFFILVFLIFIVGDKVKRNDRPEPEVATQNENIFRNTSTITLEGGTLTQDNEGNIFYQNDTRGYSIQLPKADYIEYLELKDLSGVQLNMDTNNCIRIMGGPNNYGKEPGFYENILEDNSEFIYYCSQAYRNAHIECEVRYQEKDMNRYGGDTAFCEQCRQAMQKAEFIYDENLQIESAQEHDTSEYVLPNSSIITVSKKDLHGFSEWECKVARNEIYAKYGRMFKDEELQAYFDNCSWYLGYISPDEFDESIITAIERQNIDTITSYEKEMGYR